MTRQDILTQIINHKITEAAELSTLAKDDPDHFLKLAHQLWHLITKDHITPFDLADMIAALALQDQISRLEGYGKGLSDAVAVWGEPSAESWATPH